MINLLVHKTNYNVCKRNVPRKIRKFYEVRDWSFEVSMQSFISRLLNFRSEFEVGGGEKRGVRGDRRYMHSLPNFQQTITQKMAD